MIFLISQPSPLYSGKIKNPGTTGIKIAFIPGFLFKEKYTRPGSKIFFHPDYTVGAGISPVQFELAMKREVAGYTAGRELHPTLKI